MSLESELLRARSAAAQWRAEVMKLEDELDGSWLGHHVLLIAIFSFLAGALVMVVL
jgi:hypothetical protein